MKHFAWTDTATEPLDLDGPRLEFTPFDLAIGPEMPMLSQIKDRLREDPDSLAVDDGSLQLTRAELLAQISALAGVISA